MRRRTMIMAAMAAAMTVAASGCQKAEEPADTAAASAEAAEPVTSIASEETQEAEKEEDHDTGDAALDDPRNQDDIGEKELLAVSFGTSYNDSRRRTIGEIERALEETFPEYSVRRGFTSGMIIQRIKSRDNVEIDSVEAALDRALDNGVKELVVQPTHLMNGLEYTDLVNELAQYSDGFEKVAIGAPLLTSDEDFQKVIQVIAEETAQYDDGETAICFMGHGTEAESNQVYEKMQNMIAEQGYENYFIGTVEAAPTLDQVMAAVQAGDYKRVVLEPLMIVAGDHANNDMAGDEEGSWKRTFEDAGYEVTCILRGLGEMEGIRQIFAEHAQAAMDSLEAQ